MIYDFWFQTLQPGKTRATKDHAKSSKLKYVHLIELNLKSTAEPRAKFTHFQVLPGPISTGRSMLASLMLSQLF